MTEDGKGDYVSKFRRTLEAIDDNPIATLVIMGGSCIIGLITFAVGLGIYQVSQKEIKGYRHVAGAEKEKIINSGLELKTGYYNNNDMLDEFYEIDGRKIPVEVDGKSIDEYLINDSK